LTMNKKLDQQNSNSFYFSQIFLAVGNGCIQRIVLTLYHGNFFFGAATFIQLE